MRTSILVAAIGLAWACGASRAPSAGPLQPDGGAVPVPDGGVSSTGDAGTPSTGDAGAPATGSESPGTGDAGATSTGDSGGAAAADGGASAGGQPEPSRDECADLRAPAPGRAGGRHAIQPANGGLCLGGMIDGNGTLALQSWNPGGDGARFTLHFVSPGGELMTAYPQADVVLTEQLSGFEGQSLERIDPSTFTEGWMLRTYDTAGHQLASIPTTVGDVLGLVDDPLGGMVLQVFSHPGELRSYDTRLRLRWRVPLPLTDVRGTYGSMTDRAGNTLVLFPGDLQKQPNTVEGMWIDHGGHASELFRVAGPFAAFPSQVSLTPRVRSGLFVRVEGQWTGQIDTLRTSAMSPAPEWLLSRPGTTLHMVRNGTGYAVLPQATDACAQTIEVFSPSGKACGASTFSSSSSSCKYTAIRVGYDGTAVMTFASAADRCTWEWWPHFFG